MQHIDTIIINNS